MQNNRFLWLDLIRGISAVLVCAGHLRAAMFEPFSTGKVDSNIVSIPFYFITSLGHEAVIVFFVLSGFFVGGSLLNKRDGSFLFGRYLVIRLSRLWVVLIPALLFTLVIDFFITVSILNGEYITSLNSGPGFNYSSDFSTLIYNLTFFQTIFSPVFGSNGPLWSLSNEFWYYITFPLLLYIIGFFKYSSISFLFYSFLFCVLIYSSFHVNMFEGFLIWLLGVAVFIINKKNIVVTFNSVVKKILLFQFFIVLPAYKLNFIPLNDFGLAISFSVFLLMIINMSEDRLISLRLRALILMLSEISYSLYLFHFPVILLVFSLFFTESKLNFDFFGICLYFLNLIFLLVIGYFAWFVFERHSFQVRKFMLNTYEMILKVRKS